MSVDLSDLIPAVEAETSPPGTDLFPDASDDAWLLRLQNAFWEAKLFGFPPLQSYTESDGIVRPITGSTDLPREEQQLLVLFAAVSAVRMSLMNTSTGSTFRAQAGPVEFETGTQNSATLLTTIANQIQRKIDLLYVSLARLGRITDGYLDAVAERDASFTFGDIAWWGPSGGYTGSNPNGYGSW